MLVMLNLLKSGRKYSVSELANYLEVSKRVVREYKIFLEEAGIYIDSIRGPYGGYVLNNDITMPNIKFDKEDLKLIEQLATKVNDEEIRYKVGNLKKKMQYVIIDNENSHEKTLTGDETTYKYNMFSKAIKYNRKIRIKYYNLQHGESIRTVYPLSLYLFQGEWWSSCYWEEKDDMRQFHLTRIRELELLDETFDPNLINVKF